MTRKWGKKILNIKEEMKNVNKQMFVVAIAF